MSYYHDVTHSPIALWQLNGSLADSSGNGHNLSVLAGTERYCELWPDLRGFHFDGVTRLGIGSFVSALGVTGALTLECVLLMASRTLQTNARFFDHSAAGETAATNALYLFYGIGVARALNYLHESGAGVDASFATTDNSLEYGYPLHLALTRSGTGVIKIYMNGLLYATSSALGLPSGGGSGALSIGGSQANTENFKGGMASAKIIGSELSGADVLAEYNRTVGTIHGRI